MPKSLKYALMVFLGGGLYGAMLPLVRIAYDFGFSPTSAMLIQNIFSFAILIILALALFRNKVSGKQALALIGIGAITYVMSFTYFLALQYVSATVCITLMFQYVWMGIIIEALYERKVPRPLTVLACLIVMAGTMLTTGILQEDVSLNWIGCVLALTSGLAYALFLFLSKHVATAVSSVTRTTFMSGARLFLALVALTLVPANSLPPLLPLLLIGVLLACAGIVLPVLLIAKASPHLPSSVTMIMSASELPCSVLLAALLISEAVPPMAVVGIVMILGGIVLSQANELKLLSQKLLLSSKGV